MTRYRRRVAADLEHWIRQGWVEARHRQAILDSLGPGGGGWSAAGASAILGAILLGLAALSFVAANWDALPRLARFALIIGALWGAFGGAARAFASGHPGLGHALAMLGVLLFGAGIVLTAQTFNMAAFRNTGVLIWTIGAAVAASVVVSRPTAVLAALLGLLWLWLEYVNPFAPEPLWGYLALWALTGALASHLGSRVAWQVLSLGLLVWIGASLWRLTEANQLAEFEQACAFVIIVTTLAVAATMVYERGLLGAGSLARWAATVAVLTGASLQFPLTGLDGAVSSDDPGGYDASALALLGGDGTLYWLLSLGSATGLAALLTLRVVGGRLPLVAAATLAASALLIVLLPAILRWSGPELLIAIRLVFGAAVYALATALIALGSDEARRYLGGLGVLLFCLQSIYVYTVLFGTLLDTALFFFVGGFLLIGLSMLLVRTQRALTKAQPQPAREGDPNA